MIEMRPWLGGCASLSMSCVVVEKGRFGKKKSGADDGGVTVTPTSSSVMIVEPPSPFGGGGTKKRRRKRVPKKTLKMKYNKKEKL